MMTGVRSFLTFSAIAERDGAMERDYESTSERRRAIQP